ncbi:hypothetical protein J2R87_009760 [Bradyrhizobium elkanii]|nr:hypothetical protein [Bradyrhizobium elkanii]MCP1758639.1 hypothetical protein [Bradyrhizobium elkanii]MCP1975944.1 hypothetical protein [Bradyrhizobium elkanii]MCP1975953.1 hypothetical protein [Bradyrhizobium elkanii]MCP1984828.1 hypothetical protein [Bradyrhizobium elkanii]
MRPLTLSTKAFWIGLPGRNEVPVDASLLAPGQHRIAGELGAVVGDNRARFTAPRDDRRQLPRHPSPRDRGVWDCAQTLLGHVVDDVEDAEASSVGKLVINEVERPASVRPRFQKDRHPDANRLAAGASLAHGQPFLPIKPVDAVDP